MAKIDTADAISPIDGRYRRLVSELAPHSSERSLAAGRLDVEINYLIAVAPLFGYDLSEHTDALRAIYDYGNFTAERFAELKAIEDRVEHDVRAMEIWLRQQPAVQVLPEGAQQLIHIGLTSEDDTNIAQGRQLMSARKILLQAIAEVWNVIDEFAINEADTVMAGRTHSKVAVTTTFGKEMRVFWWRLKKRLLKLAACEFSGKMNGAVGTFAAQKAALRKTDVVKFSRKFVEKYDLVFNPLTTQIESHDEMVDFLSLLAVTNNILIGFCENLLHYVRPGLVSVIAIPSEDGSSTMVTKVNPWRLERAAGALATTSFSIYGYMNELPKSTLQRDLRDGITIRRFGETFAYCLLAYKNILIDLQRLRVNRDLMLAEVESYPEILVEAIQTMMRAEGIPNGYEHMKSLRGQTVTLDMLHAIIRDIPFTDETRDELLELTPQAYVGLAPELARRRD